MKYLGIIISVLCVFLINCGKSVCGNVTQTGNPTGLKCQFFYQNGTAPAKNITVKIYDESHLADTNRGNNSDIKTFTTDENGIVETDSIAPGLYVVEGIANDTLKARIDSVEIKNSDSLVSVVDTLKKCGSISGTVYLSEGGDCRKVLILFYGSDRFINPDSSGKFSIDNLAPGRYDLKIIPFLDNYSVIEKMQVGVEANKTTDLDTLKLPFTGIPVIKGLNVVYDSLKQTTLLQWETPDTAVVKDVAVYRKLNGGVSKAIAIVKSGVDSFVDTTAVVGETYVYQLRARDKDGNEGNYSIGVSHTLTSPFTLISTFSGDSTVGEIKDLVMLPDDRFVIVDYSGNQVQLLDKNGMLVRKWGKKGNGNGEFSSPIAGAVDDSGYIYILEMFGKGRIQKFDTLGNFIDSKIVGPSCRDLDYYEGKLFITGYYPEFFVKYFTFGISEPTEIKVKEVIDPHRICIDSSNLYVSDLNKNAIFHYNLDGKQIDTWGGSGNNKEQFNTPEEIAISKRGYIFVVDQGNGRINVLDKDMRCVKTLICALKAQGENEVVIEKRPRSIKFDTSGDLYYADTKKVYKCKLQF